VIPIDEGAHLAGHGSADDARLSAEELRGLAEIEADACVSLYVPMQIAGAATRQNPIRFKNALRRAAAELEALDARGAAELLQPAEAWLDDAAFWQHQRDTLAVFLAPGLLRRYRVSVRLDDLVVVTQRLHLKPLLALLHGDGRFAVLALSHNRVRLLDCTRGAATDVTPAAMPAGMAEALGDEHAEAQLQFHTGTPSGAGDRAAVYHGQGVGSDDRKDRALRYFRAVDRAVCDVFGEPRPPLVLAGVAYLLPIYREASAYKPILDDGVAGNPDEQSVEALHDAAWALVAPHFAAARAAAEQAYQELRGKDRATADLHAALVAARARRIAQLFIPVGVQVWGAFDPTVPRIERHPAPQPGDEDLLDRVAIETLLGRGTVYAVAPDEVPDGGVLAAVLRY
jgi:hypothetical protein